MTPIRERVTWMRWDARKRDYAISHPYFWRVNDADGYGRYFNTRAQADAWIAEATA